MNFVRTISTAESDEELLQTYRETTDSVYLGRLYDRYIPLVYGVCLKYMQDADEAQDAVMSLFENLLNKVLQYDIQNFRTWLYTVSRNHCLQIIREKKQNIQVEIRPDFMESDEILHLLDEEDETERVPALQHCIEKLPEHQRISIQRFFLEEQSYAEIVDATGYPLPKVKSYIQNGKRNLKICIEQMA